MTRVKLSIMLLFVFFSKIAKHSGIRSTVYIKFYFQRASNWTNSNFNLPTTIDFQFQREKERERKMLEIHMCVKKKKKRQGGCCVSRLSRGRETISKVNDRSKRQIWEISDFGGGWCIKINIFPDSSCFHETYFIFRLAMD